MARPKRVPGEVSERVAAAIRRQRQQIGLSSYKLADRLKEDGWPIHQTGVARIETGERRVDVDDLVAIASALGCKPADLLDGVAPGRPPALAMLTPEDLADELRVPVATVHKWNSAGTAPPRVEIGVHVRYARADVDKWLSAHAAGGES